MVERITLYTATFGPFPQRVEIALAEANVEYESYPIDLLNFPEWFGAKVNPAKRVPVIAYGGPAVPADQPSPESTKLTESTVLTEFIADLFPSSGILPVDPVQRAKARLFVDTIVSTFTPLWFGSIVRGERPIEDAYKSIDILQGLLPEDGKYALGDAFSIADISVAPFLIRTEIMLSTGLGGFVTEQGLDMYNALRTNPKYAKYRRYYAVLEERESVRKTFRKDEFMDGLNVRFSRQ